MRRRAVLVIALAVVVGGTGVMSPAQGAKKQERVKVVNNKFKPATVTIRKGGKVTWVFKQGRHNVVGKNWSSPIKRSGTWSKRFKRRGTFRYTCVLHPPNMNGKVRVK